MAEPFLTRLSQLVDNLSDQCRLAAVIECKHFFNGAALYANGRICATLSPAGLALKLPEAQRKVLIQRGKAGPFRFFPNGPVKKEYSLLSGSILEEKKGVAGILCASLRFVTDRAGTDR